MHFLRAFALWFFLASCAWAQAAAPDYEAWGAVATRAEAAVDAGRASDTALTGLRAEVAEWRRQFLAAQGADADRLQALRDQLAALGAAPEDGATEAVEISNRRAELNAEIAQLDAPRLRAEEALRRSVAIIDGIDAIIRDRQADLLTRLGPTPLNPALWPGAVSDVAATLTSTWSGVVTAYQQPITRERATELAPFIIVLLVAAMVMVLRARAWIKTLVRTIEAGSNTARRNLFAMLVSTGQFVVPVLGLAALSLAVSLSQFYGLRGGAFVAAIVPVGFTIFYGRWLSDRVFNADEGGERMLRLPLERQAGARAYGVLLAIFLGIWQIVDVFVSVDAYAEDTTGVLKAPLFVLLGIILIRLGQTIRMHKPQANAEGEIQIVVFDRIVALVGRLAQIVGVVAPVLGLVGYVNAGEALLIPACLTLGMIGTIIVLQALVFDLHAAVTRSANSDDALLPVILNIVLVLLAVPVFALIWGARQENLIELWETAQNGVELGDTQLTPGSLFILFAVFGLGYMLTRFVQSALRTSILPKTKLDQGGRTAVVSGVGYVGIFLAALVAISSTGLDLSSLAIVAGALSVGIGFGLQTIVSNFVSGIILLIERPISEGDWIEVGGNMGYVRDISVRSTRIETFDRSDVIVPNADLISGTVTNYTRGNTVGRVIIPVGVAYGTDTRKVETILREIAESHPMVLLKPAPGIIFQGFGADSMDFEIRAILRDVNWMLSVKSDVNHAIAERFAAEGIEIPFAQRDVWLRNPETLSRTSEPE